MDGKRLQIDNETFCCSVCLDLLKDPVTIPCGHSYCMSCVNTHWDGEVGKQSYSCPQCRQNFTQRPVLVKNTMLAVLMEGLKKSAPPAAPLPPSAAPGEVFCDLCSGREVKAVKSCLQCQVSYCKEHLQPHYDVAALKKHKLVEPTENLQENMCSRHDEVMKMFCRTDQQCICYLCSVDQHKGHHTVTAAAERAEKQRELQAFEQNILQKIKLKEENVGSLQQQLKNNSLSADAAVQLSDRSLKDLLHLLEKRMSEVRQEVRSQQEAEEHRVNDLQDKVQQELTELRRKFSELDTLSHTEDHVTFLHKFPSLSKIRETSESVKSSQTPPPFKDTVTAAVSKLKSRLQDTSLFDPPAARHKTKVSTAKTDALPARAQVTAPPQQRSQREGCTVTLPVRSLQPQPTPSPPPPPLQNSKKTSRSDRPAVVHKPKVSTPKADALPAGAQVIVPLQTSAEDWPVLSKAILKPKPSTFQITKVLRNHFCRLTLDRRSLNTSLVLSNQSRSVQRQPFYHNYLPNPDRFTDFAQVVTKETLSGQCYWEVLGDHTKAFTVAVAYKDIRRDGSLSECCFGKNNKSWALECYSEHFVFWHNGVSVQIESPLTYPRSSRLGIYLDQTTGILSFYKLMSGEHLNGEHHIYTARTTFTRPLVAGVRLDEVWSMAEFC